MAPDLRRGHAEQNHNNKTTSKDFLIVRIALPRTQTVRTPSHAIRQALSHTFEPGSAHFE